MAIASSINHYNRLWLWTIIIVVAALSSDVIPARASSGQVPDDETSIEQRLTVVLRSPTSFGFNGWDLVVLRGNQVLDTQNIGNVLYYGSSEKKLVTLSAADVSITATIFDLPTGHLLSNYSVSDVAMTPMMSGPANAVVVTDNFAYFLATALPVQLPKYTVYLVKLDLMTGHYEKFPVPGGMGSICLANNNLLVGTGKGIFVFSIADKHFVGILAGELQCTYINGMGIYCWGLDAQKIKRITDKDLQSGVLQQPEEFIPGAGGIINVVGDSFEDSSQMIVVSKTSTDRRVKDFRIQFVALPNGLTNFTIDTSFLSNPPHIYVSRERHRIAFANETGTVVVEIDSKSDRAMALFNVPLIDPKTHSQGIRVVY